MSRVLLVILFYDGSSPQEANSNAADPDMGNYLSHSDSAVLPVGPCSCMIHIYIYTYTHIHIYIYVHVYICMFACICIYIYTPTHVLHVHTSYIPGLTRDPMPFLMALFL